MSNYIHDQEPPRKNIAIIGGPHNTSKTISEMLANGLTIDVNDTQIKPPTSFADAMIITDEIMADVLENQLKDKTLPSNFRTQYTRTLKDINTRINKRGGRKFKK